MAIKIPFTKYKISKSVEVGTFDSTFQDLPFGFYPLISLGGFNLTSLKDMNINTPLGQRNAYIMCPAIRTIINTKVNMSANARFVFHDKNGKEINSRFQKLIDNPSKQFKNWDSFWRFVYTLVQIHGVCMIYNRKLPGISQPEAYVMPNWDVMPQTTTSTFFGDNVTKYIWTRNGMQMDVEPEEIIFISDTSFDLGNINFKYENGGSRMVAHQDAIKNIIAAYEIRGQLQSHGGPEVILSPAKDKTGGSMMTPDERERIEKELRENYGKRRGQKQIRVAEAPVTATKLGSNPKDLGVFEEVLEDLKEVCRCYGMPEQIFGISGTTFNNMKEAKQYAISNTVQPETVSCCNQIASGFGFTDIFTADFSHLPEMQVNEKDKVDVFSSLTTGVKTLIDGGIIKPEQALEIIKNNCNLNLEVNGKA